MKDNTKRYFFLWLAIFFVGIGLVFADSVVILLGDVNRDGEVNVADITAITNYVHGSTDGYDATAADVNRDGEYNVSDITGVTNIVHYGTPSGSTTESILFFPTTSIEKTYGDAAFTNTIVRAGSTGAISYTVSPAGVLEVASDGTVTIVGGGTATITATLAANGTFEETSASYTVTVAKVAANSEPSSTMTTEVTAKKTTGDVNQSYTGDPLPLVNAGESSAGTLKYKVTSTNEQPSKDSGDWTIEVPTAEDAGTYYVWYYAEGNDNYEETAVSTEPIVVTIDNATPTVTTAPAIVTGDLAYTGAAQALATEATGVTGGTVKYFVSTENTTPSTTADGWTTTIPEMTDAGTYYVWYYVDGTDNYVDTDVQSLGSKTISKAAATTEASTTMTTEVTAKKTTGDANQSYTGGPLPLVNAGESSAGTLKYKVTTSATPAPSKTDEGWSESVPTAEDAGTYYVWYYAEGNDNYEETAVSTEPIVVTIDKASFIPVVTLAGWTYGSPNTPSVGETNTSDGAVTYSYKTGDAEWTTTQPTDVGTHQVKASIAANGNYSAAESAPVDFTISQREATLSWDNTALTYNGAEQAPTCTVSNIVGSDVCTVTVTGGQTNAGSGYTATATALSNSNYKLPAANTTTFSIGNATMTGITAAGFSGDYDGSAHGITLNGVPTDATVKYGTTEGTYDLTISPAYTNAGDAQTVYYQVTKDNYAPVTGSATVTISQKEVTLTWGTTSFTYNGSEQTPTCTAGGLIGSDECTVTVTGGRTNVGSGYTATAESLSNSNYKLPAANTQSFTISKVAPTYTAPAYTSLTYTGSAQNLVSTGTSSDGTFTYSTTEDGTYSETIPQGTDAGSYTVWYKLTGDDNHNDVAATQVTGVTIAKAACTVSLDKTSLNLTNSSATGTINVTCDGDGTVTAESSNTSVATVSVSGNTVTVTAIANGSATITIKVSEGTNHTAYTATDKTVSVSASGFMDVKMNPLWYVAQYNMTSATAMASTDNAGYFFNWSTAMTNFAASSTSYSSYTNASKSISGQSGTWHLPVQAEWHSIVPGANTNIRDFVSSSNTTAYKSAYITPKWGYNSTTKAGVSESSWFKYVSATELHAIRFLGTDYCSAWKWVWSGSTLTISATLIGSVANSESAASAWYSSNWSSVTWGNNDSKGAVQRSFYARGYAGSSILSSGTASSASDAAASYGYYWSATENISSNAWFLYFVSGHAFVSPKNKSYGFSVRLFRDN